MQRATILLLLTVTWSLPAAAQGQGQRLAQVAHLFSVTHIDQKWRESQLAYINELVRLHPALTQYRDILDDWQTRVLSWDSVSSTLAATIASKFTAAELDTLIAFYQSPVGRKWVQGASDLNKEWAVLQAELTDAHYPDLVARLRQRAAELHKPNPLES